MHDIITDTPQTGIRYGMDWDEYRATQALNPSSIVECEKSELHVRAALQGSDRDTP
jgi:hypothetical protein